MQYLIERTTLILAALTALFSVFVTLLDFTGFLSQELSDRIPNFALLLLALTASYLIAKDIGVRKQLDRIERLAPLSGLHARLFLTSEEAFEYIARRFALAERRIQQIAFAPSVSPYSAYKRYDQALVRVLKANKVDYRYIALFDKYRWERIKPYVQNSDITRFYVRYFEAPISEFPGLSFIVMDDVEVIIRYPYEAGGAVSFMAITHPEVVGLFSAYFKRLWEKANILDKGDAQKINSIDKDF